MQHNKNNETPKKSLFVRVELDVIRLHNSRSFLFLSLFFHTNLTLVPLDIFFHNSQHSTSRLDSSATTEAKPRTKNARVKTRNEEQLYISLTQEKVLSHNFDSTFSYARSVSKRSSVWVEQKSVFIVEKKIFRILLTCARKSFFFVCCFSLNSRTDSIYF